MLWAIPTWRNSFVFHSLDKVTSVFIHLFPALLTYVKRWEAVCAFFWECCTISPKCFSDFVKYEILKERYQITILRCLCLARYSSQSNYPCFICKFRSLLTHNPQDLMCDASTPCHMDWASATLFPLAYYSVWQVAPALLPHKQQQPTGQHQHPFGSADPRVVTIPCIIIDPRRVWGGGRSRAILLLTGAFSCSWPKADFPPGKIGPPQESCFAGEVKFGLLSWVGVRIGIKIMVRNGVRGSGQFKPHLGPIPILGQFRT